jgi:fructose-1,6-bisphosphatase/inositol monophosphatase family enzyme
LKADGSFVTDVDLAVEDALRSRIHALYPDHGILGEERAESRADSPWVWIIDPVDGTHSLRHRVPLFGTLLALRYEDESVVGAIDLPGLDRTYLAAAGLGATCNGRPLTLADVESASDVEREIIATGERRQFVKCGRDAMFDRLMRSHPSVRTYCDCFGHVLAIEGAAGAMVDFGLHLWDIAATEVLVREVGGDIVRIDSDERAAGQEARHHVVFGKPTVVAWVLSVLKTDDPGDRAASV